MTGRQRLVFDGWIAGLGTTSGTRMVVGHWPRSPFGPMSDVMVETADGHRRLLAPSTAVAEFIATTYTFDTVHVVDVEVRPGPRWSVRAGDLDVAFTPGRRGPLGLLLRAVPPPIARRPGWIAALDRPAALLLPGVRTVGSAGNDRREWYGAQDLRPVTELGGTLAGETLGALAMIDPPVRFGFGSVPPQPSLVKVTTTVQLGA